MQLPPSSTPPPSRHRPLLTLRTAFILIVGMLVAACVAVVDVAAGVQLAQTLTTAGAAFAGTVTFLDGIIA